MTNVPSKMGRMRSQSQVAHSSRIRQSVPPLDDIDAATDISDPVLTTRIRLEKEQKLNDLINKGLRNLSELRDPNYVTTTILEGKSKANPKSPTRISSSPPTWNELPPPPLLPESTHGNIHRSRSVPIERRPKNNASSWMENMPLDHAVATIPPRPIGRHPSPTTSRISIRNSSPSLRHPSPSIGVTNRHPSPNTRHTSPTVRRPSPSRQQSPAKQTKPVISHAFTTSPIKNPVPLYPSIRDPTPAVSIPRMNSAFAEVYQGYNSDYYNTHNVIKENNYRAPVVHSIKEVNPSHGFAFFHTGRGVDHKRSISPPKVIERRESLTEAPKWRSYSPGRENKWEARGRPPSPKRTSRTRSRSQDMRINDEAPRRFGDSYTNRSPSQSRKRITKEQMDEFLARQNEFMERKANRTQPPEPEHIPQLHSYSNEDSRRGSIWMHLYANGMKTLHHQRRTQQIAQERNEIRQREEEEKFKEYKLQISDMAKELDTKGHSVIQRLYKLDKNRKDNSIAKLKNEIETKHRRVCTFKPETARYSSTSNRSSLGPEQTSERLYAEAEQRIQRKQIRQQLYAQKQKEKIERQRMNANHHYAERVKTQQSRSPRHTEDDNEDSRVVDGSDREHSDYNRRTRSRSRSNSRSRSRSGSSRSSRSRSRRSRSRSSSRSRSRSRSRSSSRSSRSSRSRSSRSRSRSRSSNSDDHRRGQNHISFAKQNTNHYSDEEAPHHSVPLPVQYSNTTHRIPLPSHNQSAKVISEDDLWCSSPEG